MYFTIKGHQTVQHSKADKRCQTTFVDCLGCERAQWVESLYNFQNNCHVDLAN